MTLAERLNHLPEHRRDELERIVRILFDEFEEAQKGKLSDKRKGGRILKLVLFGSYANAEGRSDTESKSKTGSDDRSGYDLLVVVSTETFADPRFWSRATERFLRELTITKHLATPVNLIVHSIMDLNNELTLGRPFFADIIRGGIMFYETPGVPLAEPGLIDPVAERSEALKRFGHWFPSATHRLELATEAIRRGYGREAAFDLHQTVERFYHCVLHVLTLHSPKSHRLAFLRAHAERVAPSLIAVWPEDSRFTRPCSARQCFSRLDRAYVEARYSPGYRITREELVWLAGRAALLRETVAAICTAHLDGFNRARE
ncbi:HEPN domain-containing protein [Agrobacterium tumefaciens]|uniref:HEPN domain-containing protein n=1 Tax=Agrobacterium tumefaciens TaxID=358 RepID=A0A4D7YRH2_AGRTU|nr:HEPN domain-containing protein [Agrobacterium tumefaciens]